MKAENLSEISSVDIAGLARLVEYFDSKPDTAQNPLCREILTAMLDLARAKTAFLNSCVKQPETIPAEELAETGAFDWNTEKGGNEDGASRELDS